MTNVLFWGMCLGLFMAWFCFVNRDKNAVGFNSLTWLLLSFSCILFEQWLFSLHEISPWMIHVKRSTTWMPFLFGPLFYLACRSLVVEESRFRLTDGLHAMPALIHFIYLVPFYLQPVENKLSHFQTTPIDVTIFATFKALLMAIYLFMGRRILKEESKKDTNGLVTYLRFVLDGFFVCIFFAFIAFYLEASIGELFISADEIAALSLTLFFTVTSVVFVYQWRLFALSQVNKGGKPKQTEQDDLSAVFESIKLHIEQTSLYQNPSLKIEDVAQSMSLPMHYVSYVINTYAGENFQRFINRARVETVKVNLIKQ